MDKIGKALVKVAKLGFALTMVIVGVFLTITSVIVWVQTIRFLTEPDYEFLIQTGEVMPLLCMILPVIAAGVWIGSYFGCRYMYSPSSEPPPQEVEG